MPSAPKSTTQISDSRGNPMSSISKTADHFTEQAKTATWMARASLLDLGSQALRLFNNIRERESNGLFLAHLGRRPAPNRLAPALWFAAGATVAGGAFLLLAPRGAALRGRLGSLMNGVKRETSHSDQDNQAASDMINEGGGSMPRSEGHPAH
jgi:hypothetical protein